MAVEKISADQRAKFDPQVTFCFAVEVLEISDLTQATAYFRSVGGLKSESEVIAFAEGGLNQSTRQLPGPIKWPNLVLKRGFTGDPGLLAWRQAWELNDGKPKERRNGFIYQLNRKMQRVCRWEFVAGWPCKWEGPEYDASKNELAIETLEIAHEGLFFSKG